MKKALLVIDVQNDYFPGGAMPLSGADDACRMIRLLLERFRADGLPVIYIRHTASRPDATFFLPGTKGAEIHPSIQPLEHEPVIDKHFPNSFRDTDLVNTLKEYQVTELVVCGMMTHMCVDATVRAARDLGYQVTVIADGCATKELIFNGSVVCASDVQNSFLAALSYYYAHVLPARQWLLS
jgi:nicotinamidase-related amidase